MGAAPLKPVIRQYFEQHAEITVWRNELIDHITKVNGRAPSIGGLQGAIGDLITSGFQVEQVEKGHAWRYNPNAKEAIGNNGRKLFELVHETKGGVLILEGDQGETLIVRRIEI